MSQKDVEKPSPPLYELGEKDYYFAMREQDVNPGAVTSTGNKLGVPAAMHRTSPSRIVTAPSGSETIASPSTRKYMTSCGECCEVPYMSPIISVPPSITTLPKRTRVQVEHAGVS